MCYPKPGPRCSGHARATLTSKQQAYDDADAQVIAVVGDNFDNKTAAPVLARLNKAHEELQVAQEEYDSTPEGQQVLRREIVADKRNGVDTKSKTYRLLAGEHARNRAIASLKGDRENYTPARTSTLLPGDTLVGSGFVVTRTPYADTRSGKGKMWVEGFYPGQDPKRHEWSRNTTLTVIRDGDAPGQPAPSAPVTPTIMPSFPTARTSSAVIDKFAKRAKTNNHVTYQGKQYTLDRVAPTFVSGPDEEKAEIRISAPLDGGSGATVSHRIPLTYAAFEELLDAST